MRCKSSNCTGILGRFRWSKCVLWQLHNMQRKARPDGHLTTLRRHAMFPKEDPPACYVVPLEMSAGGWINDLAHFRFCLDQRLFFSIKPSGRSQSQEQLCLYHHPQLRTNLTKKLHSTIHTRYSWVVQVDGDEIVARHRPANSRLTQPSDLNQR